MQSCSKPQIDKASRVPTAMAHEIRPLTQHSQHKLKLAAIDAIRLSLSVESAKRKGRDFSDWGPAEAHAVWKTARDFAQQHGLRIPLLAEVVQVEKSACGHSDYGAKWALYVAEKMFM